MLPYMAKGLCRCVNKDKKKRGGEGLRYKIASYKNSHRNVRYNIGNTVINTEVTVYGIRWILDLSGWSHRELYK